MNSLLELVHKVKTYSRATPAGCPSRAVTVDPQLTNKIKRVIFLVSEALGLCVTWCYGTN